MTLASGSARVAKSNGMFVGKLRNEVSSQYRAFFHNPTHFE